MSTDDTVPDDHSSNRERRLREAVADLPEPFETTRERSVSEGMSRHLSALRQRLDWLVELEDRYGPDQENMHRHRAERNGLIFALRSLAPIAEGAAYPAPPAAKDKRPDPAYVTRMLARIAELEAEGYSRVERGKPGLLFHERIVDSVPVEAALAIWFYFLARQQTPDEDGAIEIPPLLLPGDPRRR